VIAAEWYAGLRAGPMGAWLPPALEDQHLAGGILWGAGDLVGLVFFLVLFAQWARSSIREAAREDRRLDLLESRER
jgi:putative copper resistance protein D